MGKRKVRLSKADNDLYNRLLTEAEKYFILRTKCGPIEHVDDGEHDFKVALKWKDLLSIMVGFHAQEVAKLSKEIKSEAL
jgi:hypothetical protein